MFRNKTRLPSRNGKSIYREQPQRRSLSREARKLAVRIENIYVSLADYEARDSGVGGHVLQPRPA